MLGGTSPDRTPVRPGRTYELLILIVLEHGRVCGPHAQPMYERPRRLRWMYGFRNPSCDLALSDDVGAVTHG